MNRGDYAGVRATSKKIVTMFTVRIIIIVFLSVVFQPMLGKAQNDILCKSYQRAHTGILMGNYIVETLDREKFISLLQGLNNSNVDFDVTSRNKIQVWFVSEKGDSISLFDLDKNSSLYITPLLYNRQKSWVANLLLYSLFELDGFALLKYQNNGYNMWLRERSDQDINYWKSRLR